MWQPQGFYNQYVLRTPVLLAGPESVRGLYNYPASRIAVIHGRSFKHVDDFVSAFAGKDVRCFERSWTGEPDLEGLKGTVGCLESFNPDLIIAVGGGSVIDGCKLCRLFYEVPYYDRNVTRLSGAVLKTGFVAVPTTIGSGAEVSSAAVYVDRNTHAKNMIVMHELLPEAVVYDGRYVEGTPSGMLVRAALDAMAHLLEGYVSNVENVMTEPMAEEGMALLHAELSLLVDGDLDAVSLDRLQHAGFLGGIVQNHRTVGAAHGVAHQLTEYGYAHSEAVGLLLPAVIKINSTAPEVNAKYRRIAGRSGFEDVDELLDFIRELQRAAGIFERRGELTELMERRIPDEAFCESIRNDRGGKGNPLEITDEYVKELIGSI